MGTAGAPGSAKPRICGRERSRREFATKDVHVLPP